MCIVAVVPNHSESLDEFRFKRIYESTVSVSNHPTLLQVVQANILPMLEPRFQALKAVHESHEA